MATTEADLLDNPVAGQPTLILRSPDFHSITEAVAEPVERPAPIGWWLFFLPSVALMSVRARDAAARAEQLDELASTLRAIREAMAASDDEVEQ